MMLHNKTTNMIPSPTQLIGMMIGTLRLFIIDVDLL